MRIYAARVLDALGVADQFDGIHDIHAIALYAQARSGAAMRSCVDHLHIDPARSLFVEDMARNLKPAKALGMTTVWVDNGSRTAAIATTCRSMSISTRTTSPTGSTNAFTLGNLMTADLQPTIDAAWEARDTLGPTTEGRCAKPSTQALAALDDGSAVSPKQTDGSGRSTSG